MNWGTQLTKSGALAHCRTLSDLVEEYNRHFSYSAGVERSEGHHDPVVDFCKEAPDLETCVRRAVDGRRRDGKVFSEGSCVRTESKKIWSDVLIFRFLDRLKAAKDFEQVYDAVRDASVWGIGNLSIYNTSARIAAYKNIHPEKFLYLHAGPLQGWKRLTGCKGSPYRVPIDQVPEAMRVLPMHRLEDFLCEWRDVLNPSFMENAA